MSKNISINITTSDDNKKVDVSIDLSGAETSDISYIYTFDDVVAAQQFLSGFVEAGFASKFLEDDFD